jgi:hypothetical protein
MPGWSRPELWIPVMVATAVLMEPWAGFLHRCAWHQLRRAQKR